MKIILNIILAVLFPSNGEAFLGNNEELNETVEMLDEIREIETSLQKLYWDDKEKKQSFEH